MRNNVIKLLQEEESLQKKVLYNKLLEIYGKEATAKQVYHYQLGYTPGKLEGLIYDIKKIFHIKDKEIVLYKDAEDDEEINFIVDTSNPISPEKLLEIQIQHHENAEIKKKNDLLAALKLPEHPDVLEGMKFRQEYPFLENENTPMELKALVTDKITAYRQYAGVVGTIISAENLEQSEEKLYELAKEALEAYEVNQEIKKELDFYRDSGRILGEHETLKDLKMIQDVNDMSEADLVKNRANAMKNVSKNNTAGKTTLAEFWKKKQGLIEERLKREFNHTFADK
ncbi:hypothetical protein ACFQO9_04455 [Chryseobacterium zhengzhouense]|uniref:Uncharacterized protein n=1 Tax=Chryseobacterium zhengzhouense TaxID=1636086 RepID=A0ABW2LW85_9FLAO